MVLTFYDFRGKLNMPEQLHFFIPVSHVKLWDRVDLICSAYLAVTIVNTFLQIRFSYLKYIRIQGRSKEAMVYGRL